MIGSSGLSQILNSRCNGNFKTGYQTPAMAYGGNLILEIDGCKMMDL